MVAVTIPTKTFGQKLKLKGDFEKTLSETLFKIGMELEEANGEETTIDIAGAGNRIDAVSLEGIARIVSAYNGRYSLKFPTVKKSSNVINVDKSVAGIRPFMGNFIVRNLEVDEALLKRMINYQEKIAATFGRDRKVLGMGLFRLPQLKFPLQYIALPAKQIKFAPLGFEEEMTGDEILAKHEKGREYAHLFAGKDKLPILRDATGRVLTMPGITNSNDLGRVEPGKQDLFVEATGTDLQMIVRLLTANALDLAELGATIETCTVNYAKKKIEFPQFEFDRYILSIDEVNSLLGLKLTPGQCCKLLEKMLLPSTAHGNKITANVPRFRSDIMHKVDLIEDIARAYGFDNFDPIAPSVYSFGKKHEKTKLLDAVVNSLVGMEFQQVIGMLLTNKTNATEKMKVKDNGKYVELHSSRALGLNACRQSLLPELLAIVSSNKQYPYPQKIFDVGECLELNHLQETGAKTTWKTAAVIASGTASFAEIKAIVEALGRCLDDYKLKIEPMEDSRFISGRCAKVTGKLFNGVFGEVDLEVLRNFNVDMPCAAMEIELKQGK